MNKVPTLTVKMAARIILLSQQGASRQLEDLLRSGREAGLLKRQELAPWLFYSEGGRRSVAALGLILDPTECFLPRILVPRKHDAGSNPNTHHHGPSTR